MNDNEKKVICIVIYVKKFYYLVICLFFGEKEKYLFLYVYIY